MAIGPSDFRFFRPDNAWLEGKQSWNSELSSECEQELHHRIEQASRIRGLLALLLLEVEQVKPVKDPGTDGADNSLLSEFFLTLMKKIPGSAGVARFGEKEFALMLPGVDATVGIRFAKDLKNDLESTRFAVGKPPREARLRIGIGVAVYPHDGASARGLLDAASLALSEAKSNGNGGVNLYFGEKTVGSQPAASKAKPATRAAVARKDIPPHSFGARAEALDCGELDLISASLNPPEPSGPGRNNRSEAVISLLQASLQPAPDSAMPAPVANSRPQADAGESRWQTTPVDAALQMLGQFEREFTEGFGGPAPRPVNGAREQRPGKPQESARAASGAEFQLICASLDPVEELRDHRVTAQPSLPPSLQNEAFQPFPNSPARSSAPPRQAAAAAAASAGTATVTAKTAWREPERPASPQPAPVKPAAVPEPSRQQKPLAETQARAASSVQAAEKPQPAAGETTMHSGTRREQRLRAAFPVQISGMDSNGKMFEDNAATIDITTTGARLSGITQELQRGYIIEVKHRSHKARYVVKWVGEKGTADEGQAGVQLIDQGKLIWGRALPRVLGDQPTVRRMEKPNEE